jgi:hypothetical protein
MSKEFPCSQIIAAAAGYSDTTVKQEGCFYVRAMNLPPLGMEKNDLKQANHWLASRKPIL